MKAVVLLSGGQDSTTCLHWALREYGEDLAAVSFDYGQRHRVELAYAGAAAVQAKIPHVILQADALRALGGGSLTNPEIENTPAGATAPSGWHAAHDLPPSFVPGRNLLFFTLAAAYGIPRGAERIVAGVCQQDAAGYPDCREQFVEQMAVAIRFGMDSPDFEIDAPLLHRTKARTWQLADELGCIEQIIHGTNTCYEGDREHMHEWGYGCGECGACVERARGYKEWRETLAPA